jgi:hypothetical protein
MRFKSAILIALLGLLTMCISCVNRDGKRRTLLSRPEALSLAEQTFKRTGLPQSEYDVNIKNSENGEAWIVSYTLKGGAVPPGNSHTITVDKRTGLTVLFRDE